jgi:hypothetical protein
MFYNWKSDVGSLIDLLSSVHLCSILIEQVWQILRLCGLSSFGSYIFSRFEQSEQCGLLQTMQVLPLWIIFS